MAGGRACDPPSPRLLLLTLLLLIPPSRACMETVLQNGTMADAELVVPQLTVPSSCACCALCHHHDTCSSISFNAVSGACRLYSSVPDFSRITVDADSALFVRPGRSNHLQFCRHDSDCVDLAAAGDRCHGRVCTDDPTVTCRDLAETMGAPMNDVYYGSLDGMTTKYYCASHSGIDGWTLISRMTSGK
ncbi:hypothetical protein FJT64_015825 [Amphibalanus amphitrite]|uniref:Apple domain-containing protein n=1 Tax=Amphibalanus amphitrite TaxID=1232801 RepID=A0A6A4XG56_AMPAM|nr:hypothetical protein FJT64_015825 [Amphibalanus amphitrite]